MVIREVCRRGKDHQNFCEDSSLIYVDEQFVHIAVFDGCSSGIDSHFASFFFSRMLRKTIKETLLIGDSELLEVKMKRVLQSFFENVSANKKFIDVSTIEFLSTIVYAIIDKRTWMMTSMISGDGELYINSIPQYQIQLEKNNPDYLAYYLEREDSFETWYKTLTKISWKTSMYGEDIAIATDGLESFKKLGGTVDQQKDIIENYLIDRRFINLDVMLERKSKILENIDKMVHTDDLAIVRVIFEKDTNNEIL